MKKVIALVITIVLAASTMLAMGEEREALVLEFTPPTERVDGTALDPATEIDHYTVYCRAEGGEGWPSSGYEVPGLSDEGRHETTAEALLGGHGRYECVMSATDTDGRESGQSNMVSVIWLAPPLPPELPTQAIIIR